MDVITEDERQEMRDVLRQFYGDEVANWGITIRSYELLGKLLSKTRTCSNWMDWVPRPYTGGNAIKWTVKQARKAVVRKLRSSNGRVYIVCMRAAALAMKSEFRLAGFGH